MLGSLFFLLYGDVILVLLGTLYAMLSTSTVDILEDPNDSRLFETADFMFPENFLSRYPHEANAFRLKILVYLVFNLLVKGYGDIDPGSFWSDYNNNDYERALIDAVFYEYLTNFTDTQAKDDLRGFLKSARNHPSKSNEEMAIDRIGQYLDRLFETEPRQERLKDAYEVLSGKYSSPKRTKSGASECKISTLFQTAGVSGIDYPNFCEIPKSSFSCADKQIPGIYADYETGCQAFHVCWPHRIDSFLCPIGTIFNQSLLTCDVWHNTGCFSSPQFFNRNQFLIDGFSTALVIPKYDGSCESLLNKPLRLHMKFLPAKCEVAYLADGKRVETKNHERDANECGKLKTTYNMVREMLEMLREIRNDLAYEMKSRVTPWIHAFARESRSAPESNPETSNEAIDETNVGETRLKSPHVAEQVSRSGKLALGKKFIYSVKRSTLVKPSKSFKTLIKSSRKQTIPKIGMKSLRLGNTILNKGLPLRKKMIIDRYRKIKSKKY